MSEREASPVAFPYTPGRFVVSWVGHPGARDPFALTAQVKAMREGFERAGRTPALMLVVVEDAELEAAVEILTAALDAPRSPSVERSERSETRSAPEPCSS